MPRDLIQEQKPDLSTPSLPGLAWLLRHPESWPANHRWSFGVVLQDDGDCGTVGCAIGVAQRQWPHLRDLWGGEEGRAAVFRELAIDAESLNKIFYNGMLEGPGEGESPYGSGFPVPSKVADEIDRYLAR